MLIQYSVAEQGQIFTFLCFVKQPKYPWFYDKIASRKIYAGSIRNLPSVCVSIRMLSILFTVGAVAYGFIVLSLAKLNSVMTELGPAKTTAGE